MVNILVLEAQRAGAVIVGEDLGTVESWVQDFLAERGILGTTIAWFERAKGVPTNPQQWRPDAMTSVTVHDLPPTLGYLAGDHVELRNDLGLLTVPVADERLAHDLEIQAWRTALERSKLLRPNASDVDIMLALHRYITWSPSKLLSVALPDLVGQRETQNQPGTIDEYPNWRVPLADGHGKLVFLEDLPHIELLKRLVSAVGGRASHS
jgi:4-alpha-glucanotransferase